MSLSSFFQFFVPKEKKFYPLYQQQAAYIDKAATLLRQMLLETNLDQLEALRKDIKVCETEGDKVLRDFYSQLFATVLTPFDRDDVHELAEMMDTFLDRIDDSANIVLTRRFLAVDADLTTMAENIMFAAENLSLISTTMTNSMETASASYSKKTTPSPRSSNARTWCRCLKTRPIL